MARAEDRGRYYRVHADDRDLNYDKYFVEGEKLVSALHDFNSHNAEQLTIPEIKSLLLKLDYIKGKLDA